MSDLPRIGHRSEATTSAGLQFGMFMADLRKRHELTRAEIFAILSAEMSSLAHYCIRSEREEGETE